MHGFESDYYTYNSEREDAKEVYADLTNEKIDVYQVVDNQVGDDFLQWLLFAMLPFKG